MRPVLFSIGSISFSSFGIFAALAFLVGTFFVWRRGRNERLSEEKILDTVFASVIYAFIGARIGYVWMHFNEFSPSLLRFFLVWKFPGLSLVGTLVFGIIGVVVMIRRKKFNLWQIFDIYAQAVLLTLTLLAFGGLLDGAEVGRPTTLFWGVPFAGFSELRHPIGLYEALFGVIAYISFLMLHKRFEKQKRPYGIIALLILLSFSLVFFVLAFFKEDSVYFSGLTVNQLVFSAGAIGAIVLLYHRLGRRIRTDIRLITTKLFRESKKD